jgi:hypothetical protein
LCRASRAGSGISHSFLHGNISDYSATASFAVLGPQVREPTKASGSGILELLEELWHPVIIFFIFFIPVLVGPNSPMCGGCLDVPEVMADKSPLTCYNLESYVNLDADNDRARGPRQVHYS